jgi:pimeloyl-ACP methyl ester carboxylesterase
MTAGALALPGNELVLLLHGLFRSRCSMKKLAKSLRRNGYRTHIWGYQSTKHPIEHHGRLLAKELRRLDLEPDVAKVHFVGHSLGCIVVRHALSLDLPKKMGRVVMLAPPNRGSGRARRYSWVGGWLSPAVAQLTDEETSWVQQLELPRGYEFGVVAGTLDGTARLCETELSSQTDHVTISCCHTFIMKKPLAFQHTLSFLKTGRFPSRSKAEELLKVTRVTKRATKKAARAAAKQVRRENRARKRQERAIRKSSNTTLSEKDPVNVL